MKLSNISPRDIDVVELCTNIPGHFVVSWLERLKNGHLNSKKSIKECPCMTPQKSHNLEIFAKECLSFLLKDQTQKIIILAWKNTPWVWEGHQNQSSNNLPWCALVFFRCSCIDVTFCCLLLSTSHSYVWILHSNICSKNVCSNHKSWLGSRKMSHQRMITEFWRPLGNQQYNMFL